MFAVLNEANVEWKVFLAQQEECAVGGGSAVSTAARWAGGMRRAGFAAVADAGHAAHLERPDAVAALLAAFLGAPDRGVIE